jgi:hypothetical protein
MPVQICGRLCKICGPSRENILPPLDAGVQSLLITNALFIKLDSAITASYSLGWLVRLVAAAVAVVLFLR